MSVMLFAGLDCDVIEPGFASDGSPVDLYVTGWDWWIAWDVRYRISNGTGITIGPAWLEVKTSTAKGLFADDTGTYLLGSVTTVTFGVLSSPPNVDPVLGRHIPLIPSPQIGDGRVRLSTIGIQASVVLDYVVMTLVGRRSKK